MKKYILAAFVLSLFASDAFAAPSVCRSVFNLPGNGMIYKNSAPLRKGGVGTALVGFRRNPTLIGRSRQLSRSGTKIFAENGANLGRCPWASAHGEKGGRYRCTMNTTSLRRAAQKNGGPQIYFTLPGGACARVAHAGKCNGSVKGQCNSTF